MSATLAANYRSFELPWTVRPDDQRRFHRLVAACLAITLVMGLILPWLPVQERALDVPPPVPPRFAKLVLERTTPPPPPPPVVEQAPPEEVPPEPREQPTQREAPTPAPDIDRTQQARKKAAQAGLLPFVDQLADLRDKFEVTPDKLKQTATPSATQATGTPRAERSLVTSKAGTTSGGINTAAVSAGFGYGEGSLEGHGTTQVQVPFGGSGGGSAVRSDGVADGVSRSGSGKRPSRTQEEIELVFDRNKAAIYALYNRALRDNPSLKGKVVMQLTIAPTGEVTDCSIVSSELGDPELERKLVARVKMFRFEDKDVETITTTKPIEFFPA